MQNKRTKILEKDILEMCISILNLDADFKTWFTQLNQKRKCSLLKTHMEAEAIKNCFRDSGCN